MFSSSTVMVNKKSWLILLCRIKIIMYVKVHYHVGFIKCAAMNSSKAVHFFVAIASLLISAYIDLQIDLENTELVDFPYFNS